MKENKVVVVKCKNYDQISVNHAFEKLFRLADNSIFNNNINSGETVFIKPNWIKESHTYYKDDWEYVITHPSIITSVIELVVSALRGKGKIIIGDAPQTDSSFKKILQRMPVNEWQSLCQKSGIEFEIIDLREHEWITRGGVIISRQKLPSDPRGSVMFDLKNKSCFDGKQIPHFGYYGADYDSQETTWAHSNGRHLYKISRSVIESNVIINLPKLKTHKKAGVTLCLKNIVGINSYKNYIPHYSIGAIDTGGDQFPNKSAVSVVEKKYFCKLKQIWAKRHYATKYFIPFVSLANKIYSNPAIIRSGNWFGNDTLWRSILDLNRILCYGNLNGLIEPLKKKRLIYIVDGVIAGQGEGPMSPSPFQSNVIIAGINPLAVDCVCTKLMGFDYKKIPSIANAFNLNEFPLVKFSYNDIEVASDIDKFNKKLVEIECGDVFHFVPSVGWTGHIEL